MTIRRREFAVGAAGAVAAGVAGSVGAAEAAPRSAAEAAKVTVLRGTLRPGAPDWVYLPVEVAAGTAEVRVSYAYERPSVPPGTAGNALDIGLFDERGTALGGRGFRGWSGGARAEFFVRGDEATPGYLAGPVRAGTWYVLIAPYSIAPEGLAYTVTVTLTPGPAGRTPRAVYPPERTRGRGRAWYRGDCHLHSVYSDGRRTPAEIAAAARAAGLDFINSAEHNTHSAHGAWEGLWGDDLLILVGEEVTTRTGHVLAVGTDPGTFVDWRYRARDRRFGRYAEVIRRAGGLVVPAHPHATCVGCAWKFGFGEADAVEVWNGPHTADDEVALAAWDAALTARRGGGWLPAIASSDAHREPDRVGSPQTVVLADELSREAVLAGLRAGRSYLAESSAVTLSLVVSGPRGQRAGIGGRLRTARADDPVTVRLEVSGAPGRTAHLVTDQGTVHTVVLPDSATGAVEWTTSAARSAYVRAEVRHPSAVPGLPGAPVGLTNPVWLGGREGE